MAKRVQLLCGCYRRDDAADPKVYASAIIFVMEEYPIEVVEYVTSPRTGLPSTCKFLPSVAEVVEACNAARVAQKQPMDARQPLGKPTPPSKVNPRMWDSPEAKARHERDYTKSQTVPGGQEGLERLRDIVAKLQGSIPETGDGSA